MHGALEMNLTGNIIEADQGYQWALNSEAVEQEQLLETGIAWAKKS